MKKISLFVISFLLVGAAHAATGKYTVGNKQINLAEAAPAAAAAPAAPAPADADKDKKEEKKPS